MTAGDRSSVVVVGAGVFGAATARELASRGWVVTLVDAHEPGHVRASSGGESRLIRCSHGEDVHYTRWARQAWRAWGDIESETAGEAGLAVHGPPGVPGPLLERCGVAWFARRDDGWESDSASVLAAEAIPFDRLGPAEAARLYPSLRTEDLMFVLFEPEAGVLHARRAVQALVASARRHGALLRTGLARPVGAGVAVDGEPLGADAIVWACGPWLPRLFGDVVGVGDLRVTKQDVTFFGADARWRTPPTPGWVDYDGAAYGLGDLDGRGVKCAPDVEGPDFDPDDGRRELSPENERRARTYLSYRFPALEHAPLLGSRTCQYTLTADTHFVLAPHPEHDDVWLAGGGSGHAFKHGPVLGAVVADLVERRSTPEARFALGRRVPRRGLRTAGRTTD